MNKSLFIHRVQLPQRDRQQVSNDHTPIPGMNLFGQSPGASVMAERTAVDEHQDLIASLDVLAQRAETFDGLLGEPTVSQQQGEPAMQHDDQKHNIDNDNTVAVEDEDQILQAMLDAQFHAEQEEEQRHRAYLKTPDGLRDWAIEARNEARQNCRQMVRDGELDEDDAKHEEQRAVVAIVKRIGERLPGSVSEGPIQFEDAEQRYQEALSKIPKLRKEDSQEARARFDQAFDQARGRIAELRELNLVQPSQTNEDLLQQSSIELPGGSKVSLIDFKDPMAPAIDKALAHQASNVDFDRATDDTTPLHTAVQENKLDLVQSLLDHGADPNFEVSEFAANADAPLVPLMRAQSPEMVDLLCKHGADVQQCLWHEDMLANPQVTQAFLDRGLNPNARTQEQHMDADESTQGESALHLAQDPEVARRLVLAGADIQANAGTREKPLSVTQKWAEDPESFGLIPVSKGPEFEQAIRDASAERQHLHQQHQENTVEKNMKPDEMQRVPPTLSAALANGGMAMPRRHATLGEAAAAATGQGKSEGEGQGGRQGGQERPSHSSYYNPVPVGGMSMPQRSNTIGDAVVQREAAQKRRRSQSI